MVVVGFESSFEQEPGGEHPGEDFEHLAQRRLRELVADDEEDQAEGGDAAGGRVRRIGDGLPEPGSPGK
jgi:hypothetical protein